MDKPRILIVEDDLDLSDMLGAYFRVQNYEVRTAAWGQEAIKISREEDLSLIMLDIRLPDINGYEVCRQLRQNRRTQDLPIIFLTEKRDRVDKLQGLELGVVDYITKPFDIQELRLRVRNAIQRASQQNMINPVTELPGSQILEERLGQIIYSDEPWSLLLLSIVGLGKLREAYGFVAADEMMRAVTLMIRSAIREYGNEGDFVAHFGPEELVIITTSEKVGNIRTRVETRIRQSLMHFYRPKDEIGDSQIDYLDLRTGVLNQGSGKYGSVDDLKEKLSATIAPPDENGEKTAQS
jgi:PleD family two-component response regulator